MSSDGDGPLSNVTFLSQPIGVKCLASLLGVGSNRLRRGMTMTPDLRVGKAKSGSLKPTFTVDAFLATLHQTVAETLPDRWGTWSRSIIGPRFSNKSVV